jgi:formylglycine-generating enzyme required for sulfatase activity
MKHLAIALLAATMLFTTLNAQDRGFIEVRRQAKDHVALIIGNSEYPDAPLGNPVNDATDVAQTFTNMGFIVDKVLNADKEQMAQAINRFSQRLLTAKAAVFYYAGHGVQVNGENYLIPIGKTAATQINEESQVPYRAINAGEVLASMERAKVNFSLIVLDACRNNPFKGEGRGRVPGLASINAPVGSLVMYATKAGAVASDGQNQRNSPFTTAFLTHVSTPGLDVNLLPSKITQTVGELTSGKQVPGTYMQLNRSFAFVPELTAEEERALKETQLKNLKVVDAEMARKQAEMDQKKREDDALLAKKQAEISALDKQIADLKAKTASGTSTTADADLDKMLEFVKQKEAQKKELERLQKQAEESRIAREKELYNIMMKEYNDKDAKINADIEKYKQIANSEFGKDMAQAAWDNILTKYGLTKGSVSRNDEYALKYKANPHPGGVTVGGAMGSSDATVAFISGGSFTMGNSSGDADETPHTVSVGSFSMMKHEVTVAQFKQFIDDTGYQTDADKRTGGYGSYIWDGSSWVKKDGVNWKCGVSGSLRPQSEYNHPVIHVSWNDAMAYAQWLSRKTGKTWRLPTEAEWEFAARGGTSTSLSNPTTYAGSNSIDEVAWYSSNSGSKTQPVGQKKPNGFGLYDMSGNVWEWCADWYSSDYYKSSPSSNPLGPSSGSNRVLRGGGWSGNAGLCRVSYRYYYDPEIRSDNYGFRLVLVQ